MRKTQIYKHDKWISIPFDKVRKGNKFRMIETGGVLVSNSKGENEWIALSDAFRDGNGQWTVKINEPSEEE